MNKLLVLTTAAAASACMAAGPPPSRPGPGAEMALSERLRDRVPGQPVKCVRQNNLGSSDWIDEGTLVFSRGGGTIYVNNTRSACPRKGEFAYIRTRSFGSANMCAGDLIEVVERGGNISRGTCMLGNFTPYRRR